MSGVSEPEYVGFPLRLFRDEPVLGAVDAKRLKNFADLNLVPKIAIFDGVMRQGSFLTRPTAVYRGLKRPMAVPGAPSWYAQDRIIIAVSKPDVGATVQNGRCVSVPAPEKSVFLTYLLKVDDAAQKDRIRATLAADHARVYLAVEWEWVICDDIAPHLPNAHQSRFEEKFPWP